jgi:hypothetical protein
MLAGANSEKGECKRLALGGKQIAVVTRRLMSCSLRKTMGSMIARQIQTFAVGR